MSTEVCPFCGKTFKRLKSHLPHCKAAASSKEQDVTASQSLPSHPSAAKSKTTAKGNKQTSSLTTDLHLEKVSQTPGKKFSSLLQTSPSMSSTSPSPHKKIQKVSDQIKTTSPLSSLCTVSKLQKKSVRAVKEAAKPNPVIKESMKETRSASAKLNQSCRTSKQTETKTSLDKDPSLAFLSADTGSKVDLKKKGTKIKSVLSTTKHTSDFLDSNVRENSTRPHARDNFWLDCEEEGSVHRSVKSESGHQVKATLQDVKATLGRTNSHHHSSRPSILSRIPASEDMSSKFRFDPVQIHVKDQKGAINHVATPFLSDELISSSEQNTELQLFHSKCKQPALILKHQLKPASPAAPLLLAYSSELQQATLPPPKLSLNQEVKVCQDMTGLPSASGPLCQFSRFLPAASQILAGRVEELQLKVRKQDAAEKPNEGTLTQQGLGQVKLKELPRWLACRKSNHPGDVVELVQRGWLWYYRRYTDVKKGSVAGLSMLLAGCVLSYIWSYPHIKLSHWRKYH